MSAEPPPLPQISADGRYYWDGTRWLPTASPGQLPTPPAFYAPTPYIEPQRRGVPNAVVITVGVVVALLLTTMAGGLAVYVNHLRSGSAGASATGSPTPNGPGPARLSAGSGVVVFTDDFHDPVSGWFTGTTSSGTAYGYSGGAYVIDGHGYLTHYTLSPYAVPLPQASATITATQTSDAPPGAGLGVMCQQGTGQQLISYWLYISVGAVFHVSVVKGPDSPNNLSSNIKRGTSGTGPGSTPVTIVGDCLTAADGKSTRLVLFVNGVNVADVTDPSTVSGSGWQMGIVASSEASKSSTVTYTRFEERDLSKS